MNRIVLLTILLIACGPKPGPDNHDTTDTGKAVPVTQTCSCDTYPFPANCASQCEKVEALVTSLSPDKKTAFVTIEKNGVAQKLSIPASQLPNAVPGATVTTLLKKNPAAPETPQIVRFLPSAKSKPVVPAH